MRHRPLSPRGYGSASSPPSMGPLAPSARPSHLYTPRRKTLAHHLPLSRAHNHEASGSCTNGEEGKFMHGSRKLNLERHDGAALSSPARAVGLPTSPWLPHVQRCLFHWNGGAPDPHLVEPDTIVAFVTELPSLGGGTESSFASCSMTSARLFGIRAIQMRSLSDRCGISLRYGRQHSM
jgi:hypothetical protein